MPEQPHRRIKKAYEPHTRYAVGQCAVEIDEQYRTQQHMKDHCDIMKIVAKWKKTGQEPVFVNRSHPLYGDFTKYNTLSDVYAALEVGEEAFMSLPASTRSKFENDPRRCLQYLAELTDDQVEEAEELGFTFTRPERPPPTPPPDPPSSPADPPAPSTD